MIPEDAPASPRPLPPVLAGRISRLVHLDVREDIARGVEPFARIMEAAGALREGEALALRVPFEPVPLYRVLGQRGLVHQAEQAGRGDWSIFLFREGTASSAGTTPAGEAPGPGELATTSRAETPEVLDVRGLEPPWPMVRVLERLETLAPGEELLVIHERRPLFLYPQLEDRGFVHETRELGPGEVRILVRRGRPARGPGVAAP
jgi:uncharacterized protein (DUF2249 family)